MEVLTAEEARLKEGHRQDRRVEVGWRPSLGHCGALRECGIGSIKVCCRVLGTLSARLPLKLATAPLCGLSCQSTLTDILSADAFIVFLFVYFWGFFETQFLCVLAVLKLTL